MNPIIQHPAGTRPRLAARWLCVLAASMLAGCGDSTGSKREPVASVQLAGIPEDIVLAGTTVQLTATPTSSKGAALTGRVVSWQSSDTTIATVAATGAVSVVGAGNVTIAARSEGKEGSVTLDARAGGQLGPEGGTLRLLNGKITVSAQAGALQFPVMIVFRPSPSAPIHPRSVPGTTYDMEPFFGIPTSRPLLLTVAYDAARLPAGATESSLQLYQVVDGSWRVVFGSNVDTTRDVVRASLMYGGTYTVAAAPPAP